MKRTRSINPTRSAKGKSIGDDIIDISTDSDEQWERNDGTDVTEPDDSPRPRKHIRRHGTPNTRKRLRSDDVDSALGQSSTNVAEDLYSDPLDDTGSDLCEIDDDFNKADGTIDLRERIEDRWTRYCIAQTNLHPNVPKWRSSEEALRQASSNDMYRFLGWCLKLKRGKDGRKLKGIKCASALKNDWKYFRVYHQRVTKIKIDDVDAVEVRKGIEYLVVKHRLNTQEKPKTPVYIEDIGPLNKTILSTKKKRFDLGFQRIQVCLFNSLALFTIHRKGALLSIQFKDLQISLQKDPHGGPPIPLIELTPEGCKKLLGNTKLTTFALPEVVFGPSLLLFPHTLLFGVLFHARAFRNPELTSKTKLRRLFVNKGCQQLLVPLDPKKADWYVFCKTNSVKGVPTIQRTEFMSSTSMSQNLVTFGEIQGWPGTFHAHQFRYGSGTLLNESGWVSGAEHQLIMKHADSRTFLQHYHPRLLTTDTTRILCGLDPDKELSRAIRRQNRWEDPRRPRYLTEQQRAEVEHDPDLKDESQQLSKICSEYDQTQQQSLLPQIERLKKDVQNTRARLHRALRKKARDRFDEEQAFLDIEAQLSGKLVEDEDGDDDGSPRENDMHPLHSSLLKSLCSYPKSDSLEDEWNRRDVGADSVTQYCDFLEGGPLRGRRKRETPKSTVSDGTMVQTQGVPRIQDGVVACKVSPLTGKPLHATREYLEQTNQPAACFQCFANERLPKDARCRMFHDAGCVSRHFDAIHLNKGANKCNWCEVTLLHQMAFQRHAFDVHRVRSRRRYTDAGDLGEL